MRVIRTAHDIYHVSTEGPSFFGIQGMCQSLLQACLVMCCLLVMHQMSAEEVDSQLAPVQESSENQGDNQSESQGNSNEAEALYGAVAHDSSPATQESIHQVMPAGQHLTQSAVDSLMQRHGHRQIKNILVVADHGAIGSHQRLAG